MYSRKDTSEPWGPQPDSIELVINTSVDLLATRNNRTFIELRFPVNDGVSWDGNFFNSLNPESYKYDGVGIPCMPDSNTVYPSCLMVVKSEIENLIEIDRRSETYASGIGSVSKSIEKLRYKQIPGSDTMGVQGVEGGILEYWVINNDQ